MHTFSHSHARTHTHTHTHTRLRTHTDTRAKVLTAVLELCKDLTHSHLTTFVHLSRFEEVSRFSLKVETLIAYYPWSSLVLSLYRCFQMISMLVCCADERLQIFFDVDLKASPSWTTIIWGCIVP